MSACVCSTGPPFHPQGLGFVRRPNVSAVGGVCAIYSVPLLAVPTKKQRVLDRVCAQPKQPSWLRVPSLCNPLSSPCSFLSSQFFFVLRALPRVAARTNVVRDRSPRWEAIVQFQTDTTGRHRTPRLLSALCLVFFFLSLSPLSIAAASLLIEHNLSCILLPFGKGNTA